MNPHPAELLATSWDVVQDKGETVFALHLDQLVELCSPITQCDKYTDRRCILPLYADDVASFRQTKWGGIKFLFLQVNAVFEFHLPVCGDEHSLAFESRQISEKWSTSTMDTHVIRDNIDGRRR